MADTDTTIDVDAMSDDDLDSAMESMREGKEIAPPAAQEPAPEPVADLGDDAPDTPEPSADGQPAKVEVVPFGKFDRQRHIAKEANERAKVAEDRLAQLMELWQRNNPQPEPTPQPEALDLRQTPIEYIEQLGAKVDTINQTLEQRQRAERESQQEREVLTRSQDLFRQAVTDDPGVQDAYQALYASFAAEAQAHGLTDRAQLQNHLAGVEKQHIFYAMERGIPIGDYVKGLAKARGWAGAPKPAAIDPAAAISGIQEADAIKRAATSLTSTGGAPARTGVPTPQQLLDMTPKQFNDFMAAQEKSGKTLSSVFAA